MAEATQIRVVTFKEGDVWVAQCLEYDIAAHAPDLDTLHARLLITIDADRQESIKRHGKPFAGIDPATRHFHEMWERQSGVFNPRSTSTLTNDGRLELDMALCA